MQNYHFPSRLLISPTLGDNTMWTLKAPFKYVGPTGTKITVPKGFKTNFASVPKIFHNIIGPWGKHGRAAIIHDYLYSKDSKYLYTRKQADKIFLEVMKVSGVGMFKRHLMYRSVRLFGNSYYKD